MPKLAGLAIILAPALMPAIAHAQNDEQNVVDRSTLALQDMMTQNVSQDPRIMLGRAKAVMICPRIFKAGFFIGGSGGNCVLLGRDTHGGWSYPAFYAMGSGSFGLQIGVQDSSFVMMILTEKGLNAVLNNSVKLGADASVALATIGGGVQGSTTTAVGADIVAFSQTRGIYGGISLEGSVMSARPNWDQAYYNQPIDTRQIVVSMQGSNPGAEPLRSLLMRYGSAAPSAATAISGTTPMDQRAATSSAATPPPGAPTPLAPVQQQSLPPAK
ncbi:MAG: lipid-binding SYLF domain-containing protein [Rhodospirillales bacterium]|nr:lipid-binding SYLF domain-containing protein [Rhodospirillales bacterium]